MPGHLDVTGKAHEAVGNAINKYFHALTDCLSKMGLLVTKSRGDHGMVQAAVTRYNAAELAAAAAWQQEALFDWWLVVSSAQSALVALAYLAHLALAELVDLLEVSSPCTFRLSHHHKRLEIP